jgi:hypothetical protein
MRQIMGQNKVTLGGRKELILDHNETKFGTKLVDFLEQEQLVLGQNETNYGTKKVTFWAEGLNIGT